MSTQSLLSRLDALSEANKSTLQLIQRLSKLTFQPGTTALNGGGEDVRVELSSEIHESLRQQEQEFELLKQEAEDFISVEPFGGRHRRDSERDRERSRISVQVARLGEDLKAAREHFRRAQLTAKRSAEAAQRKERELLFANLTSGATDSASTARRRNNNKENLTAEQLELQASSDVTASLRRLHSTLQSELTRSRFAHETLEQSSAALKELKERYSSLDDVLATSRNLLGTLLKSQKSDTWYLETAFYILLTTIIWLVYRRFLYGPLWWFVWLPIKLSYRFLFFVLGSIGLTGRATSATVTQEASTSLRVQPSATGRLPTFQRAQGQGPYIRAGGGGYGAKMAEQGRQQQGQQEGSGESLYEQIGNMAEASQQQRDQPGDTAPKDDTREASSEEKVTVRGDGTVLEKRGDRPANPKKRMWEDPPQRLGKRDEL
ncbi:Protein transport protein sec20 [Coniosporium apollinis]|uniref:Protein transport protein sec20 n=2 Tax=Coniosporium TaxID=2810619 RepID=A0ABQ9P5G5_9PEZI|nr:Protein transport protein sec20 [Cladosporium sp. JES 115]KAJ9669221.1 Protein transport protein sec20 [Coniosporium apollinis]